MVSIIIPSYKDPYLHKTIFSLLSMRYGDIEIIPVLDGYVPDKDIIKDRRVKPLYLKENGGMRNAINQGVKASSGEFIMRTDEHCMFCPNYDKILTETFEDNWIVVPRRYKLDPVAWTIMDDPPVDYEKLKIVNYSRGKKFSGVPWNRPDRDDYPIDETMAMQGSCWIMKRSWWDTIGELESEGYGTHYQDSHEMVFKTWKKGGMLMVNKNAWYAHKHRKFPRTHGYGGELADKSFAYALKVWGDYYKATIKPKWNI
jgi:glycosyltransferase involved in cell wall biosynthesis